MDFKKDILLDSAVVEEVKSWFFVHVRIFVSVANISVRLCAGPAVAR